MEQRRGMAAQPLEQAQGRQVGDQLVRVVDHEHEVAAQPSRDFSGEHLRHRVGLRLPVWLCVRAERECRRPGHAGREAWESVRSAARRPRANQSGLRSAAVAVYQTDAAVRPLGEQHALADSRDPRRPS